MRSERGARPPLALSIAALGGLLFLHVPLLLISASATLTASITSDTFWPNSMPLVRLLEMTKIDQS